MTNQGSRRGRPHPQGAPDTAVHDRESRLKRLLLARGGADRLDRIETDIEGIHAGGLERRALGTSTATYPKCLLITGEPGVGKTELIRKYVDRFQPEEATTRTIIRAFSATIPAQASIRAVTAALLEGAGAPAPDRGEQTELTRRLARTLKQNGVEIIVLDEFQHLVTNRRSAAVDAVADWLKTIIINLAVVPIVVVGLPGSDAVLRGNEQLQRRFKRIRRLRPFNLHFKDELKEFRKFLHSYETAIGFPTPTKFASSWWLKRIYVASSGRIGHVADLLQEAGRRAIHEDAPTISTAQMAASYYDILSDTSPAPKNPFEMTEDEANVAYNQVLAGFDRHRPSPHP